MTVTVLASLLCLGLTIVVIDSFSTMKFISRRPNWKRSRQCPASRSYGVRSSVSRLFLNSDFSSHPYSVYYGTSGSQAQQNFGQNDDINDVYGYSPNDRDPEELFNDPKQRPNRNLQSMQAIPLFDGRRGATVFGKKYRDERPPQFYRDPRMAEEREMMYEEDGFIEEPHMLDQMDSLVHERDHLRSQLDAVVSENIHLHNQNNLNGVGPQVIPPQAQNGVGLQAIPPQAPNSVGPDVMPPQDQTGVGSHAMSAQDQNQFLQGANGMPQGAPQTFRQENPSTTSAVKSVMDQLKNMRQTVQAFEAQHRNPSEDENSTDSHPKNSDTVPSVESMKSELKNMEQILDNLEEEKASASGYANGYDTSTGEASNTGNTNLNGSASSVSEQNQSGSESTSQVNGSRIPDDAVQLFDGQYEVVIKAELKKKNGVEGTYNSVEKQIDVNKDSSTESPTVCGGSFGSNYI